MGNCVICDKPIIKKEGSIWKHIVILQLENGDIVDAEVCGECSKLERGTTVELAEE